MIRGRDRAKFIFGGHIGSHLDYEKCSMVVSIHPVETVSNDPIDHESREKKTLTENFGSGQNSVLHCRTKLLPLYPFN